MAYCLLGRGDDLITVETLEEKLERSNKELEIMLLRINGEDDLEKMKNEYLIDYYKTLYGLEINSLFQEIIDVEQKINDNVFWLGQTHRDKMVEYLKFYYSFLLELPFTEDKKKRANYKKELLDKRVDINILRDELFKQ